MFCIAFHFFSKPPRQPNMTLGRTKRRDSFGLEVRQDGSLAFDFPREESNAGVADRHLSGSVAHGAGIDRQRRGSRPQLYKTADIRTSIGPLMRRRRRRDSFGLEVREDGTLSFDQLASGGTFDLSRVGVGSEDDESIRSGGNMRRNNGVRDSLTGSRTGPNNSGSQRGGLRRRDSFGLEVRADGTLSLDRLVNTAQEGTGNQRISHLQNQSPSVNRILAAGSTRVAGIIAGPRSSANRGEDSRARDGFLGPREVQLLMERIRRLEAELARHGRPPTRDAMDVPPAYESRSTSSETREQQSFAI